jgi:hypothetical protein
MKSEDITTTNFGQNANIDLTPAELFEEQEVIQTVDNCVKKITYN